MGHIQKEPKNTPNMKITISQKCANIYVLNFAQNFVTNFPEKRTKLSNLLIIFG